MQEAERLGHEVVAIATGINDALRKIEERLQPWIHRLALKCKDRENSFVDAAQRLASDEPLQRLVPENELPDC